MAARHRKIQRARPVNATESQTSCQSATECDPAGPQAPGRSVRLRRTDLVGGAFRCSHQSSDADGPCVHASGLRPRPGIGLRRDVGGAVAACGVPLPHHGPAGPCPGRAFGVSRRNSAQPHGPPGLRSRAGAGGPGRCRCRPRAARPGGGAPAGRLAGCAGAVRSAVDATLPGRAVPVPPADGRAGDLWLPCPGGPCGDRRLAGTGLVAPVPCPGRRGPGERAWLPDRRRGPDGDGAARRGAHAMAGGAPGGFRRHRGRQPVRRGLFGGGAGPSGCSCNRRCWRLAPGWSCWGN